MRISVTEAKGQLTDLVRRAEVGEDIVLTRHGHPAVRLAPVTPVQDESARGRLLEAILASGRAKASRGPSAERSQDFLYDERRPSQVIAVDTSALMAGCSSSGETFPGQTWRASCSLPP